MVFVAQLRMCQKVFALLLSCVSLEQDSKETVRYRCCQQYPHFNTDIN